MTLPIIRRRVPVAPAFQLVERTPHYTIRGGRIYQDVVVRDAAGVLLRARVAA